MKCPRALLLWSRIPRGLRHLRKYGVRSTLRILFPSLRNYRRWIAEYDRLRPADIKAIRGHIGAMTRRPSISVLMVARDDQETLIAPCIASLTAQLYPDWSLYLVAEPTAARAVLELARRDPRIRLKEVDQIETLTVTLNDSIREAKGELVMRLDAGDQLAPHALYLVANEVADHPQAALVYSDEDFLDSHARRQGPRFKSDWNPQMLLGCDAIGRLAVYQRMLIESLGGFRLGAEGAEDYDLALRASETLSSVQIRHLPYVLYHRGAAGRENDEGKAERRALAAHFVRTKEDGVVVLPGPTGETHRVVRPLPAQPPLVSLIVPVGASLNLVRNCLSGILNDTNYSRIELLIMVNNGTRAEVFPYLDQIAADQRVSIIDTRSSFNFSRICNLGVELAQGEVIGLVNDDVEVIEPTWLCEMVSHAVRPEIGAVGAKLYYPDDTIQHAGVILVPGLGGSHWFRHAQRHEAGYCNRLLLAQNLSVVTAACLVLRKKIFKEVGGFDEEKFAIAFNDIDLCLKIREKGYLIVWTPFSELYHMESASRGSDFAPEQITRFRREVSSLLEKWAAPFANDPYCNPNLAVYNDRPDFAFPPRIAHPWRRASLSLSRLSQPGED